MSRPIRPILTFLTLLALSCGGEEPTVSEEPTAGTEEPVATEPAETTLAWADMDRDQRLAYMQQTITPEMKQLFQEFDAERYADFGCATCHGDDLREVDFQMPNGLAPLRYEDIPGMFESEQPMAVFMTQTVWPRMTELLGAEPYSSENPEGFSCFTCHATAE